MYLNGCIICRKALIRNAYVKVFHFLGQDVIVITDVNETLEN